MLTKAKERRVKNQEMSGIAGMRIPDAISTVVRLAVACVFAAPAVFAAPPRIISVEQATESAGFYEKLELRINVDSEFTNPRGRGASPFDPQKRLTGPHTFDKIRRVDG